MPMFTLTFDWTGYEECEFDRRFVIAMDSGFGMTDGKVTAETCIMDQDGTGVTTQIDITVSVISN